MKSMFLLCSLVIWGLVFASNPQCLAGTWRDDFDDGNYKGEWKIYNLNRAVENWRIKDGEAVGEIFQPGFMSLLLTGMDNWTARTVECRAKFVKEAKDASAELGLSLYDGEDDENRYLFVINLTLGFVSISKESKGQWASANFRFVSEMDRWYSLKATVEEQELKFQVNGETFTGREQDEPLKSGQVGLIVANARAHFDDVVISGPGIPNGGPGKVKAVQSRGKLAAKWGQLKTDKYLSEN
ncbi:MAG: hypothetical protein ACE5PV_04480 [Candidatus Poribacteria bacterium]